VDFGISGNLNEYILWEFAFKQLVFFYLSVMHHRLLLPAMFVATMGADIMAVMDLAALGATTDMAMDMAIITITTTRNEWPSKTSAKKRKPQIKAKPPQ
jgi:hypothetical protein